MKGYELDLTFRVFGVKATLRGTIEIMSGPGRPGPIRVSLLKESGMSLVYSVQFPEPGAADVVKRNYSVQLGGQEPTVVQLNVGEAAPELVVDQDTEVTLSLVDVDDAGNESEPRTLTFTAKDTLAPPQPGELGVSLVEER